MWLISFHSQPPQTWHYTNAYAFFQEVILSPTFTMVKKQYRRLTPDERQYLIEHYADDPQVINKIAFQLKLEPKKVLDQARYLKLRVPNSHHSWSEAELSLLDDWAETKPLNQLVASWNRLALKQGRPQRSFRSLEKKLLERGHSLKPYVNLSSG